MTFRSQLALLKMRVEQTVGYKLLTPKDFTRASDEVFARLNVMVSPTTLKRLWGYLSDEGRPRVSTLNILSRFAGYDDWADFLQSSLQLFGNVSNLVLNRSLDAGSLTAGDEVSVSWLPDRQCRFRYLGQQRFEVVASENATLDVGDTFRCLIFVEGEPLYVDNLRHGAYDGISYMAGKKGGIRYRVRRKTSSEC